MEWKLDDLDMKLMRELNRDARRSCRALARALDISVPTAASRLRRLEREGPVRGYIPLIDPVALGYDLTVIIALQISKGKLMEVQQRVARDPRVYGVYDVTGEWDSLVLARFRSRRELDSFIKSILAIEHVERTVTQLVLNTVKEERRVAV